MPGETALDHAIELARTPSLGRKLRAQPLPDGVLLVLRLASGDEDALGNAACVSGRAPEALRDAAMFYVAQVLFDPVADSYRTLGASPSATRDQLRAHTVCLLKWLHPDINREEEHAVFTFRVLRAWDNVKTIERRQYYDSIRNAAVARRKVSQTKLDFWATPRRKLNLGLHWTGKPRYRSFPGQRKNRTLWRCATLVALGAVALVLLRTDLSPVLEELNGMAIGTLFPPKNISQVQQLSNRCCDPFAMTLLTQEGIAECARSLRAAGAGVGCTADDMARGRSRP